MTTEDAELVRWLRRIKANDKSETIKCATEESAAAITRLTERAEAAERSELLALRERDEARRREREWHNASVADRAALNASKAQMARMHHALTLAERVWSGTLAKHHGGEPEEQREPVLNCIRAALSAEARPASDGDRQLPDDYRIRELKRALAQCGIASPESMETLAFQYEDYAHQVCVHVNRKHESPRAAEAMRERAAAVATGCTHVGNGYSDFDRGYRQAAKSIASAIRSLTLTQENTDAD